MQRTSIQVRRIPDESGGCSENSLHVESPATSKTVTANTFLGEDPPELPLPSHPRSAGKQRADLLNDLANTAPLDPSVWSEAQQEQFMRALGAGYNRGSSEPLLSADSPSQPAQRAGSEEPNIDFLNALMAAQQQRQGSPGSATAFSDPSSAFPVAPKPRSKLQKLLPLIHVISVWCLFVFFAACREPTVHKENSTWQGEENSFWARWARLSPQSTRTEVETWQVQPVVRPYHALVFNQLLTMLQPFWGALATLELLLFSFRIFSGFVGRLPRNSLPMVSL